MNTATKQRLVGTIVLGALALILIPLLLDGEGVEPPAATISFTMPPPPIIDTTPIPEPQRPVIFADQASATAVDAAIESTVAEPGAGTSSVADAAAASPEVATAESQSATASSASPAAEPAPVTVADIRAPQLDEQGLPAAWSVQMGMFGDKANAEAMLARLLLANYKAYMRPQGSLNGVFVGPVMTRAEANTLRQELATEFALDAIVTQFEIAPLQ